MKNKFIIFSLCALSLAMAICTGCTANAANTADFQAGRIIDDQLFYNKDAMGSVQNVQAFIDAHTPSTCDTWGTAPSGVGNMTDAQYAQSQGWSGPPYVCLRNYYENPSTGQTSYEMGGGSFQGGQSAAQIIYNAAQQYGINPEVLLVTLRKESVNLFGDSWPLKSQYAYSMGYACPDSGPNNSANCNKSYAGFYNQINLAARQFYLYKNNITSYNYQPGRTNYIQYSPTVSCGGANVYIQNVATASLYNYTPYTPNQASLNAYPGTAPCGAYGNRNFWFFWQEWFGSTLANSNFVRTANNATVFLVTDTTKYPISDGNLISSATNLGGVGYVSQSYLDSKQTGPTLSRTIRDSDGTVYYFDSGIKLPFTSCTTVADYNSTCGNAALLTDAQIDSFYMGPKMTNLMSITTGQLYYVKSGTKSEVYDTKSLNDIGITNTSANQLTPPSLSSLKLVAPTVRSSVAVTTRGNTSNGYLYQNSGVYSLSDGTDSALKSLGMNSKSLDSGSIQKLTDKGTINAPLFVDSTTNKHYMITNHTLYYLADYSQLAPNSNFSVIDPGVLTQLPTAKTLNAPYFVKSSDGTVYMAENGSLKTIVSMDDYAKASKASGSAIIAISNDIFRALNVNGVYLPPGSLVKTPDNGTVFMIDDNEKYPLGSFQTATDIGVPLSVRTASTKVLSQYQTKNSNLSSYISCDGTIKLITSYGKQYVLPTATTSQVSTLTPSTCSILGISPKPIQNFILSDTGTIYRLTGTTKQAIASYTTYLSLGGNSTNTIKVREPILSIFTTGSVLR